MQLLHFWIKAKLTKMRVVHVGRFGNSQCLSGQLRTTASCSSQWRHLVLCNSAGNLKTALSFSYSLRVFGDINMFDCIFIWPWSATQYLRKNTQIFWVKSEPEAFCRGVQLAVEYCKLMKIPGARTVHCDGMIDCCVPLSDHSVLETSKPLKMHPWQRKSLLIQIQLESTWSFGSLWVVSCCIHHSLVAARQMLYKRWRQQQQ